MLEAVFDALRDVHEFEAQETDHIHGEAGVEEDIGTVSHELEDHRRDHEDHTVHEKHEAAHF